MKKPVLLIALLLICICSFARHSHTRNKSNVVYRNQYQRITCAEFSTFEIRNGRIYAWGENQGALGIGTLTLQENSPVQVGTDSNWISIGAGIGGNHTLAIKADGSLWAWGANDYGQLGIGNTIFQSSPVQVGADHDWIGVSSGVYHSLALKANGTLWAWGKNGSGELGTGDTIGHITPIQIGVGNDWVCIASGDIYSAAIKADGTLWLWGDNNYGVLGLGDTLSRWAPTQVGTDDKWVTIVNSARCNVALKADGSRWCWGQNDNWELGIGDNSPHYSPVLGEADRDWTWLAAGLHGLGLKDDGHLWGWGRNTEDEFGQGWAYPSYAYSPMLLNISTDWTGAVVGLNEFTFLLRSNGHLWGTGANWWGQLGLGYAGFQPVDTLTQSSTPATEWVSGSTGASHTAAIYSDGSLWTWGSNDHGQLGLGNTTEQHNKVQVGAGSTWTAAACGSNYTLALQANGSLWAWGLNTDGQLGTGNNSEQHSPVQVGGNWAAMAAGDAHALALKADGTLWAWGNNSTGQLGLGNYTNQNAPTQIGQDSTWIAIATGEGHSLGLKADGTLWAWGLNLYGQLGTGNNTIQDAPVQVGNDNHWTAISAGANYSMALKADGTLWAWGQNADGQLGLGNNSNYNTPQQVSGSNWIALNAGRNHSIAYRADGSIWSWGDNGYGQLGLGNNTNFNTPQQLSQPAIVHIFTGPEADHSGILKYTRSLICLAGKNDHGQLGDGSVLDKNTFSCMNDCVIPGITITVSPDDSVCSNEALTFTATITNGGPTPGYQWFKNNVAVGSNSDTYNAGMLNNGDQIKCVLTGSAACNVYPTDTSNVITMYVTDTVTPSISIASDLGDTICQELVATYTATITNGGPNPVYHWYENNLPVGSNSPTYVPQQVSGHTIKCVLISSAVCASPDSLASATHTLVILPVTIPQVTITANPGTAIAQNQSVTFTATVTNATNPQYQWRKNGSNLPGETQQTYTTTTLQNGDQVACRVRGLSECDTALSAPLTMSVWAVNVVNVGNATMWVNVYPNPVKDILQIGYSNITEGQMELCDMAGKLLIQQPLSHSLDLKGLASGVYLLHVLDKATGYESVHMVVKD
jgi:alpha-tubulin suppressor-like RCC1 family protein